MEQSKFLALKDLYEQYQACQSALEKLARSRELLQRGRLVHAGMFNIHLGVYRTQLGTAAEVSTEEFKGIALDMLEQLSSYYMQRLETLNQAIEAA